MFIIGMFANALVICVLLLNKGSLKAPPGIYVFHLAFADSLLLISLPFAADNRLRGYWKFGRLACKLMESMKLINFFSSIFLLTLMAVDRYLAVCKRVSHRYRQRLCKANLCTPYTYIMFKKSKIILIVIISVTNTICAAVWFVSVLMVTPLIAYTDIVYKDQEDNQGIFYNT